MRLSSYDYHDPVDYIRDLLVGGGRMLGRTRKSNAHRRGEGRGSPKLSQADVVADWTVADAKAKFSELLEKACLHGPQTITRHGRPAAVVVSPEEWANKKQRSGSLVEFFARSPLRGSGLKVRRSKDGIRPVRL